MKRRICWCTVPVSLIIFMSNYKNVLAFESIFIYPSMSNYQIPVTANENLKNCVGIGIEIGKNNREIRTILYGLPNLLYTFNRI